MCHCKRGWAYIRDRWSRLRPGSQIHYLLCKSLDSHISGHSRVSVRASRSALENSYARTGTSPGPLHPSIQVFRRTSHRSASPALLHMYLLHRAYMTNFRPRYPDTCPCHMARRYRHCPPHTPCGAALCHIADRTAGTGDCLLCPKMSCQEHTSHSAALHQPGHDQCHTKHTSVRHLPCKRLQHALCHPRTCTHLADIYCRPYGIPYCTSRTVQLHFSRTLGHQSPPAYHLHTSTRLPYTCFPFYDALQHMWRTFLRRVTNMQRYLLSLVYHAHIDTR